MSKPRSPGREVARRVLEAVERIADRLERFCCDDRTCVPHHREAVVYQAWLVLARWWPNVPGALKSVGAEPMPEIPTTPEETP